MRLAAFLFLLAMAAPPAPAQIISQGSGRYQVVALTFDAGADRGYADQILGTLERNRVRATFGMTGRWAEENRDLLRRMWRDRDQLINHTYDHRSFTGRSTGVVPLTAAQRTWEISQTERIIRSATGHSPKPYFRPPYGDYDAATLSLLAKLGYRYMIMWTVDSLGWAHAPVGAILGRCMAGLRPGAIILMHVGSQSLDAMALQSFIQGARSRGYRFVTVAELMTHA